MIAGIGLFVLVSVGRFAVAAATVPCASYVLHRKAVAAEKAGAAPSEKTVAEVVLEHRYFRSWWSGRRVPYPAGEDYLRVAEHHSPRRTLSTVMATVAEREVRRGVDIREIVVPEDLAALYGREAGATFTRADGTSFQSAWPSIPWAAADITTLPVVSRSYPPVIKGDEWAELQEAARLIEKTNRFRIAESVPGGSGRWVLHASVEGGVRRFLLVPIELSPVGKRL